MRAGRALRRIIMDRIIAEVPALSGRVHDDAMEGTAYPNVTMGPSYWVDSSAECILARTQVVQVDIWHRGVAKGVVEDLADDVAAALRDWADTDVLTMHPLKVGLVKVEKDLLPGVLHGVVQVEADVEG